MNQDLQSNLFTACPLLYKHFKGNSPMQIDCPDDLFEFIFEPSGEWRFQPTIPKTAGSGDESCYGIWRISVWSTPGSFYDKQISQIRSYRCNLKQSLLERAKAIGTTALFDSSLLPDWKRLMPDDTNTLRKILEYAEKRAIVPQDHTDLANWYKKYLNEEKKEELFK